MSFFLFFFSFFFSCCGRANLFLFGLPGERQKITRLFFFFLPRAGTIRGFFKFPFALGGLIQGNKQGSFRWQRKFFFFWTSDFLPCPPGPPNLSPSKAGKIITPFPFSFLAGLGEFLLAGKPPCSGGHRKGRHPFVPPLSLPFFFGSSAPHLFGFAFSPPKGMLWKSVMGRDFPFARKDGPQGGYGPGMAGRCGGFFFFFPHSGLSQISCLRRPIISFPPLPRRTDHRVPDSMGKPLDPPLFFLPPPTHRFLSSLGKRNGGTSLFFLLLKICNQPIFFLVSSPPLLFHALGHKRFEMAMRLESL